MSIALSAKATEGQVLMEE